MKIKKLVSALLISSIVSCGTAIAYANGIEVYVDEVKTALSNGIGGTAEPFIQDGTTYVPLRGVSEALGCQVEWDGNNRAVKIYQKKTSSGSVFRNSGDDIKVYIDDEEAELKDANGGIVKPFIIDGTTFIPLRGVSQALNCQVEWDGSLQRVSIYKNMVSPNGATLSEVKPYDYPLTTEVYYESEGKTLQIDNITYTNAIEYGAHWGWGNDTIAYFNLNGKYNNITFIAGSTGNFDSEKNIKFLIDGKLSDTVTIAPNSSSEEYSVNLNNGLQLQILIEGQGTAMGDIVFH